MGTPKFRHFGFLQKLKFFPLASAESGSGDGRRFRGDFTWNLPVARKAKKNDK
jgi:hypothetical protein